MPDVLVLGSGLAGLAAATDLAAAGLDVVVLEATDRVGGRALTVRMGPFDVELGAEWVDTAHHRVRALLAAHDLALREPPVTWESTWLGDAADGAAVRAALDGYARTVAGLGRGVDPAHPAGVPDVSAASLLDGLPPVAARALARRVAAEMSDAPEHLSLLFLAQQAALPGSEHSSRVVGGLGGLAARLAAPLDVRLQTPAETIAVTADGVAVGTPSGPLTARSAVLALPLPALGRLRGDVPAPLRQAAEALRYGPITKIAVRYPHGRWGGMTMRDAVVPRLYEASLGQEGDGCVVTAYLAGPDAGVAEAEVVAEVARQRPDLGEPVEVRAVRWADSATGGAYAVYGPGQVTTSWDVLRTPHPPLWFAGEHTATWTGYVEGAVETGQAAAAALLAAR